jgi:hypothetical protein
LTFSVASIQGAPGGGDAQDSLTAIAAGYEVQFRLPNSLEVLAIAHAPDVTLARRVLFDRCVLRATRDGNTVPASDLPDEAVSAVAAQMALVDPQANIQLALTCPACAHQWLAAFDIAAYLWAEVDTWAARVLREVHILASTYGWREADILRMSPLRRQIYLEMIGQA